MNSSPPTNNGPASDDTRPPQHDNADAPSPKRHGKKSKTLWVTVFKCFHCGKHGHNLPKCRQCTQAYYCDADCQRKHWKRHRPVCRAAVAALARHAHRLRVARAVREKEKKQEKAGGAEDDNLCVICQAKPVDPVEVIAYLYDSRIISLAPMTPYSTSAAAVWPRVLQVMCSRAAPERRGQIVPPLPRAAAAWAREAVRSGASHVCTDQRRS